MLRLKKPCNTSKVTVFSIRSTKESRSHSITKQLPVRSIETDPTTVRFSVHAFTNVYAMHCMCADVVCINMIYVSIYPLITEIYIAPLQSYYSEALVTLSQLKRTVKYH